MLQFSSLCFLSGGVSSTSTHSACIPGKQSTMEIKVHRANIRNDMLAIFADPCILDECITLDVIFINRRGVEVKREWITERFVKPLLERCLSISDGP